MSRGIIIILCTVHAFIRKSWHQEPCVQHRSKGLKVSWPTYTIAHKCKALCIVYSVFSLLFFWRLGCKQWEKIATSFLLKTLKRHIKRQSRRMILNMTFTSRFSCTYCMDSIILSLTWVSWGGGWSGRRMTGPCHLYCGCAEGMCVCGGEGGLRLTLVSQPWTFCGVWNVAILPCEIKLGAANIKPESQGYLQYLVILNQ